MTIMDKVNATVSLISHTLLDKEPLNYLETSIAHSIIMQGRFINAVLTILYNHARDPELRLLLQQAMEEQNNLTLTNCEELLLKSGARLPHCDFQERKLHDMPLDIPTDARMTDEEIMIGLANLAKASQMAILTALHHSYQPQLAASYRKQLDEGLDFDFRIMQLALRRGWLPYLDNTLQ